MTAITPGFAGHGSHRPGTVCVECERASVPAEPLSAEEEAALSAVMPEVVRAIASAVSTGRWYPRPIALAVLGVAARQSAPAAAHPDDGHDHWFACVRCGVDNGLNESAPATEDQHTHVPNGCSHRATTPTPLHKRNT